MPPKKKTFNPLAASIIFASVVLSASLVFFGLQMGGGLLKDDVLADEIEAGIKAYIQKAQDEYNEQAEAAKTPAVISEDFSDDDAVLGDVNAPVTIIEFSDYECPFCARFYSETLPQIKADYIDQGLVKLVYRDLPLPSHSNAYPAALAAECVRDQLGDAAYFGMHDRIFGGSSQLNSEVLEGYAGELNVDMAEYNNCVESEKFKDEIYADRDAAHSVNLTGTPSFIINGVVITGAREYEMFKQIIDTELDNQ